MEGKNPTPRQPPRDQQESPWLSLLFNIFLPAILLIKGESWFGFDPTVVLAIALLFPLVYGIRDFYVRRKINFISALGFVSVLLTGGVGLLKLNKDWIALKEAAIPGIIACAVFISLKTRYPLVRALLYNPKIFNVTAIENALQEHRTESQFERLMTHCTIILGCSFLLSAVLNYALARYFIKSESGTAAFNEELGHLTFWSYPVIVIPSLTVMIVALWKLIAGIHKLTGLTLEQALLTQDDAPEHDHTTELTQK